MSAFSDDSKDLSHLIKEVVNARITDSPCQPHRHVFYLKVPKTGSSTFNSIMNRMIMKHNLTSLRSIDKLPHPNEVLKLLGETPETDNTQFDTKVIHGKFDDKFLARVMQKDSVYIATIREPFEQFKSYFLFKHHGGKDISVLQQEIEDMILTSKPSPGKNYYKTFQNHDYEYLENPMYRYFKYDYTTSLFNQTYTKEIINYIASRFKVVIVDKYDESLLILKRQLCWDIKDIIYIPHKNASYSGKSQKPPNENIMREYHRNISKLDYDLFNYFLQVHNEQVAIYGQGFMDELNEYQRVKTIASDFCWKIYSQLFDLFDQDSLEFTPVITQEISIDGSRFWNSFRVNGRDCVLMAMCGWNFRDTNVASTYPILCDRQFGAFTFDDKYCANKYDNFSDIFVHDNVYFPYTSMKKIINCDLIRTY